MKLNNPKTEINRYRFGRTGNIVRETGISVEKLGHFICCEKIMLLKTT